MRLAINQFTTMPASFDEDVAAYSAAGFDGIGLAERKLPAGEDSSSRAKLEDAGLGVSAAVPALWTILPNTLPMCADEPRDPAVRIAAIADSVRRLAAFDPESIICMTGPFGDRTEAEGREIVLDGLRTISAAARDSGVRLGVESVHPTMRDTFSFLNSIGDVIGLLDGAGLDDVGVMVDTYQVWDSPTVFDDIATYGGRMTGVHLADWAGPGQPGHLLPGRGNSRAVELVRAIADSGWDGYLDVEAVSPDLWSLGVEEVARQAHESLQTLVAAALEADPA